MSLNELYDFCTLSIVRLSERDTKCVLPKSTDWEHLRLVSVGTSPRCLPTTPYHVVSSRYLHTVPPNGTSPRYLPTEPPHGVSQQCLTTLPPHGTSSRYLLTVPPHGTSTRYLPTTPPHGVSPPLHLMMETELASEALCSVLVDTYQTARRHIHKTVTSNCKQASTYIRHKSLIC
jgi:hypothetical protein